MKTLWLVCYDISDGKYRAAVHQRLKDFGQPLQYSLFACDLDSIQRDRLEQELITYIDTGDSLRWYPQCHWCEQTMIVLGMGNTPETTDYFLF